MHPKCQIITNKNEMDKRNQQRASIKGELDHIAKQRNTLRANMKRFERQWRQLLPISRNIRCGISQTKNTNEKKNQKYFKFFIWAAIIKIRAQKYEWTGSTQ